MCGADTIPKDLADTVVSCLQAVFVCAGAVLKWFMLLLVMFRYLPGMFLLYYCVHWSGSE